MFICFITVSLISYLILRCLKLAAKTINQSFMKKILLLIVISLFFSFKTYSQIGIGQPIDLIMCDNNFDGIATFDLTVNDAIVLGSQNPADFIITYHETLLDANNGTNAIVVSTTYTNVSNPQTLYIRVEELATGNYETTSFQLMVEANLLPNFPNVYEICNGSSVVVDTGLEGQPFEITWYQDGFYLQDETNPYFVVNQPGVYGVLVYSLSGNCEYYESFEVIETQYDSLSNPSSQEICDEDGDGFATFDLQTTIDEIQANIQNPLATATFHSSLADADMGVNEFGPIFTNYVPYNQTVFVRVASSTGSCYGVVTLDLVVEVGCLPLNSVTLYGCSTDPNGITTFDLTSLNSEIVNGDNEANYQYSYYVSETNAIAQVNEIASPTNYTNTSNPQTIYVRVEANGSGNNSITTMTLNVLESPEVISDTTYTICDGQEIVLNPSPNSNGNWIFNWSTFENTPEIVVSEAGIYTVEVQSSEESCLEIVTFEVLTTDPPTIVEVATDLTSCEPNAVFDLTSNLSEILNGLDETQFTVSYFNDIASVYSNSNVITSPETYTLQSTIETIYVRVQNIANECFSIASFNISTDASCPLVFSCNEGPITNSFCYENNNQMQYTYESADGIPLQVLFLEGRVEGAFDELIILDSDGVTNLNPTATTYGNGGDLSGLVFTSTGSSITIFVQSDSTVSCQSQNYTSISYEVYCVDPNALPSCLEALSGFSDGATDVNENIDISWSPAIGVVLGYTISVGLTPGGTEVLDNVDVGNVLEYELETLEFETTYYVTVLPYNTNGTAENCNEFSFTTRANPYQTVVCEDDPVNITHCYGNNDTTEFSFQSSDGQPLTIVFNAGSTEVNYDPVHIIDSDGTILNPNLEYGNSGDFTGLTYTSTGDNLTVRFDSDVIFSCGEGSACCTAPFDFDVFCASTVGYIQVNAFVDANTNGVLDAGENGFTNGYFTYELNGDGIVNSVNSSTGSFQIISYNDTDSYDIDLNFYDESAACFDVATSSFTNISVVAGETVTIDFPVVEAQGCEDLAVYIINSWSPPRPGFTYSNYLYLENMGFTSIASGTVEFTLDSQLLLNSTFNVNPAYTITNTANGFTVDFVNLQPGEVEFIGISITCPAGVALDDVVTNTTTYLTDANDLVADNNYSSWSEVVIGSYDPNDKMEAHGPDIVYDDFVVSDEWLYYTIRFQNLGTAPAELVRIEDALNAQLDESTFQMLRSSHDYVVTRTGKDLEWYFDNINLPAEQDDADGSIGFVYFRIKPQSGYAVGDIIPNTAAIYFDYNAPVITNRFDSMFIEPLSINDFDNVDVRVYPNPAKDIVTVTLSQNILNTTEVSLVDIQGKTINIPKKKFNGTVELDVSSLNAGLYFIQLRSGNNIIIEKLIVE